MSEDKTTRKSYYYVIIAACGILLGVVFMGQANLYSPIAPFLRESFGLSYTQTSIISTVQNLCSVLATLMITTVYDKLGVRRGLLVPLICGVAGALMFCVASNFVMLCIAAGLGYLCFGLGGMMPASLIMNRWFVKRKGLVLGLCSAGSGVTGMLLSGWLATRVAEHGIAAGEIVVAAFVGVGGLLAILFLRNTPEEMGMRPYGADEGASAQVKKKKTGYVSVKPLSAQSKFLFGAAVVCCGFTGFGAIPNFTMAATAIGYDPVFIGGLAGMTGALAIVGKPLYGALADAIGAFKANFVYMTLVAAADLLLFLARPGMDLSLYAVVVIFGMGCYAITTVGMPIWVSDLSSKAEYTKNLKTFQTCNTVGGLISAPLPGIIADATGNYGLYYLLLGACLLFAMVVIAVIYRGHTQPVRNGETAG